MKNFCTTLIMYLLWLSTFCQEVNSNYFNKPQSFAKSEITDIGVSFIQSPLSDYCGFDSLEPAVWIKNFGTETINTFTASYRLDFYPLVVQAFTEYIIPGDSILVTFDQISVSAGNHSIQFTCSAPNGTIDSNSANNSKSLMFNYTIGSHIMITIMTDNFGSETSWTLLNALNEVVASGNNYASSTLYSSLLCLPPGCYTFTISDSYGDGICAGYGDGYFLIESIENNTEIATGCDFTFNESAVFCVESPPGPPTANFIHSSPNNCTGEVSFFDVSVCNPEAISWLWDFGDGNTSIEQNPVHTYLANGNYDISLQITNINGSSQIIVPNSVLIQKNLPPLVPDQHFCYGENVSFFTPNNESFEWFSSLTQTTPIQISSNISFSNLEHDTTLFYQYFIVPEYHNFGLVDNSGVGGYFGFSIDRAIYFDAFSDVTISKATVFASGAASRTITLKNSGGTVLDTRVLNIPDGESIIELNFEVPAGNDYAIHVSTANNLSFTGDYGGPDVGYPFTVPDLISITGNNYSNSFWYFFYNIEVFQGFGTGCPSSRESTNAIMSPHTISLGQDTTVCNGQSIVLNAGNFSDFEWSTGSSNQEIEVFESGEYYITATDEYSCDAIGSINVFIADELFYNEIISHPSEIGANDGSIEIDIISGSEPLEIIWSNLSTDFTISNLAPGLYSYTITDSYNCEHFGQIEIFSSVGFNNDSEPGFIVFPNPASENISINSNSTINSITITGVNGQEYLRLSTNNSYCQIEVAKLPSGIYFICIEDGEKILRRKLIITR